MTRILIVEDDPDIALVMCDDLRLDGYDVTLVTDGESACERGREPEWDLILLDVMLPRKDGFDVCRDLRRAGVRTPIILVTAKTHEAEKIFGLDLGADDYVTKPFSPRELRARIRALLRRLERPASDLLAFGDFEVDFARREVRRVGEVLNCTPIEFNLLGVFVKNRGHVLSRQQLIDMAWGRDVFVTDRAVDTHIVNLRRKLDDPPEKPRWIVAIRGIGYRFDG
ncbi:MAG: response regulator transcription factor [Acidobacteria bacterium]|nr:response regulator transcription factor [Acidobacteriota bacterium]